MLQAVPPGSRSVWHRETWPRVVWRASLEGLMALVLPPADSCSFCEYLAGTTPYTVLERDQLTATLVTWEQRGNGHLLVIPIMHRSTILDLLADERSALIDAVARATQSIVAANDVEGVAVWQNNGVPANQSVPHVHFHVAGTVEGGGTIWGDVDRLPVEETNKIAEQLRPHLPSQNNSAASPSQ